ncbi:MAG TPA: HD domain-containing phosphohydrolase [Vicinamibacterales bacterium]|nr:HD domain-containing phosphohydrolase [Vicinamibacterales bacterium]
MTADPIALLKGFVSLRRLTGMYPPGHPAITGKLAELDEAVQRHLAESPELRLDVVHGQAHLDGIGFRHDTAAGGEILRELTDLSIDSIHIKRGVSREELQTFSEFLWQLKDVLRGGLLDVQLAKRNIHHITIGRLVPLDTRWRATQWPDAPTGPIDPDYEHSALLTQKTFDDVAAGKGLNPAVVRDIVQLLIVKVAGSSAALGQILSVKMYENLTYYHSVNVATLSLLIARQLAFDDASARMVVEAGLLHDIGKTRIPLEIVRKPGALDKRERKLIEAHTTFGAEILSEVDGLGPLTPTVALEHHRGAAGDGYPDLGAGVVPNLLSQLVSVADIYEAMTGARSYQDPARPEQACLVLARLAGSKLNTSLVKAFVNAISFFPIGSVVRTDRDELGLVVRTTPGEPLHPVIARLGREYERLDGEIDTSARDAAGTYERHVIETLPPPEGLDLGALLSAQD